MVTATVLLVLKIIYQVLQPRSLYPLNRINFDCIARFFDSHCFADEKSLWLSVKIPRVTLTAQHEDSISNIAELVDGKQKKYAIVCTIHSQQDKNIRDRNFPNQMRISI